ncbi:MAG: ATP-binding protein [Bdellovibrio sp.]|nr:ATP-binding protein [Bdellovibrio sp.]
MHMDRFIKKQILLDLDEKMVFLAGPRQVGKTTLSKSLYKKFDYLNWDNDSDRSRILAKEFSQENLIIFDEIHKYKTWRNYLKGIYDKKNITQKILVTGSAKLDTLRKGGDSLQGRYHFLRLMPLTFNELNMKSVSDAKNLFELSGFPEPYSFQSKIKANRWSRQYRERIVRQEVSSNEMIQDLANMEILYNRIPDLVGGTLSINSLSEDIQISHKTISNWINIFERLYGLFRLAPFGSPKIKALKKTQKVFLYDWNAVTDNGARFENFLAVHILKWVFYQQDCFGRNIELRYYRDKYHREVDFVITENNKPIFFIEAKYSDAEVSPALIYLKNKFPHVNSMQLHMNGKKDYVSQHGIRVTNVINYLAELI